MSADSQPKVTLAIATLNAARYISDAIASINASADGLEVEVALADGGSSDGTVDAATAAANACGLPISVVFGPDGGIYDGMNRALAQARGRFALILNSDDRLVARGLPNLVAASEQGGWDVASGSARILDRIGGFRTVRSDEREMTSKTILFGVPVMNARLYRISALRRMDGPFRIDLGLAADRDFLQRLTSQSPQRGSIGEVVYEYYCHEDSQTIAGHDMARMRIFNAHLMLAERRLQEIRDEDPAIPRAFRELRGVSLMKLLAMRALGRDDRQAAAVSLVNLAARAMADSVMTFRGIFSAFVWRGRGSGW